MRRQLLYLVSTQAPLRGIVAGPRESGPLLAFLGCFRARDLLQAARGAGPLESSGRFTIDYKAAIAKLRGFQVENQYHYVNRLVRAACLAGATRVELIASATRTRVHFPQCAFKAENLEELFEQIFQNQRPAAREVATATNLALALRPTRLEVGVNDGQRSRLLVIEGSDSGGEYTTEAEIYESLLAPGTTFQFQRSKGAALARWGIQSEEYLAIIRRFRYCWLPMEINQKYVDRSSCWGAYPRSGLFSGLSTADEPVKLRTSLFSFAKAVPGKHHVCELRICSPIEELNGLGLAPPISSGWFTIGHYPPPEKPGPVAVAVNGYTPPDKPGRFSLAIGFAADRKRPSTARLVYWGETLQTFPVKLDTPGVEFLISANDLNLDASGEKVIQDEAFERRWSEAKSHYLRIEQALKVIYPGATPFERVIKAYFDQDARWARYFKEHS